jgi:SET domain-containing protein
MSTYRPLPKCLTIYSSKIEGLGLFATSDIPSGTDLGISHILDERFENGVIRTPLGGFFNHSETPNCEVKSDLNQGMMNLVTIKPIKAGDELTATYILYTP